MPKDDGTTEFDITAVRRRLAELGSTQGMLASYLKVDTSAVSKGLAGKRKFNLYEQTLISRYLKQLEDDVDEKGLRRRRAGDVARVERLKYLMEYFGIDAYRLGRSSGIEARDIKRILLHAGEPMTDEMARALSTALGADLDGPPPSGNLEPSRTETIPIYAAPSPVEPLVAGEDVKEKRGRWDGMFDYILSPAGSMETPPLLRGVPGALAMYCPESGIGVRWRSGDIMFMHPRLPLLPDVEAMIILEEQFLSIGRIIALDPEVLTLQADGGQPRHFERRKLTAIYKIVGAWFR